MNGALNKVPVTIVTGFLGAGKTTLIRHVLENVRGRRLALIVNEFGDVGVDAEILRSCGAKAVPTKTSSNLQTAASAAPLPMISCRPSKLCSRTRSAQIISSSKRPAWLCRSRS